jgi:hypothetical protein
LFLAALIPAQLYLARDHCPSAVADVDVLYDDGLA